MPPGLPQKTACDLGTCYLSPAFDDMAVALKDFMQGNIRTGFFLTADHNDPPDHSFAWHGHGCAVRWRSGH